VQAIFWPSCGVLKYPSRQGQVAKVTLFLTVFAGHGRQESAGSGRGRYIPAGQAVKGKWSESREEMRKISTLIGMLRDVLSWNSSPCSIWL